MGEVLLVLYFEEEKVEVKELVMERALVVGLEMGSTWVNKVVLV